MLYVFLKKYSFLFQKSKKIFNIFFSFISLIRFSLIFKNINLITKFIKMVRSYRLASHLTNVSSTSLFISCFLFIHMNTFNLKLDWTRTNFLFFFVIVITSTLGGVTSVHLLYNLCLSSSLRLLISFEEYK